MASSSVRVGPQRRAFMASWLLAATFLVRPAAAHEIENTHVLISFLSGDEYRIEVLNDPDWLWIQFHPGATELPPVDARDARLTELASQFAAGITLLFDDNPATPRDVTYLPPLERDRSAPMGLAEPGLMRLSGAVPPGASTFRFGYGLVVDEYPLTVAPAVGSPITRWLLRRRSARRSTSMRCSRSPAGRSRPSTSAWASRIFCPRGSTTFCSSSASFFSARA